jgi:hypothetical protein
VLLAASVAWGALPQDAGTPTEGWIDEGHQGTLAAVLTSGSRKRDDAGAFIAAKAPPSPTCP